MTRPADGFPPEYTRLLDAAPDAMLVVDAKGRIVLANTQTEAIFGYPRGELLGKPVEILIPPGRRKAHEAHRAAYVAEPRARPMGANLELQGLRKDGTPFPVEISLSPLQVEAGYTIAAIRDVTERVRASEAQRRLAAVVEASVDGIVTKTLDGRITSWNPACERIFGYSAEEAVGRDIGMLYPPEIARQEGEILERVGRGETVAIREVERLRKDGRRIWVSVSVTPVRDELGRIVGATSIKRDITDRKRAEAKFAALLEAAPDAIVIVDRAGRIVLVNAQAERTFGHARRDLVGKEIETLIPREFRGRHTAHRDGYSRAPRPRPMGAGLALSGLRADGTEFPVEISLSPLETDEGLLVMAAVRDVTERKRAEANERSQLVTRRIVRQVLRDIGTREGDAATIRRQLGKAIAAETEAATLPDYLAALESAGIGGVALESHEGDRFAFTGENLLEVTPGFTTPTCHIALGYLEGALSTLHGRQALGAEVACQSRGHARCRFAVSLR